MVVVGSRRQVRNSVLGWKGASSVNRGVTVPSSAARRRPAVRPVSEAPRKARRVRGDIGRSAGTKEGSQPIVRCRPRGGKRKSCERRDKPRNTGRSNACRGGIGYLCGRSEVPWG